MKQNLTDKIYQEIETVRFLSKLSALAILYESESLPCDSFALIFEDIERRCLQVSELVEKLENL